jgi:hypothetical protein
MAVPFGPYDGWTSNYAPEPNTTMCNLSLEGVSANYIIDLCDAALSRSKRLILNFTGGSHDNYMSTINGVYQFDLNKWKDKIRTFDKAWIHTWLNADANRAKPTVMGLNLLDEPNVHSTTGGNTWGPAGTITKAKMDAMGTFAKGLFPTLRVGCNAQWDAWEPTKNLNVLEWIVSQYAIAKGPVIAWRDGALAMAARSHHAIGFSMNLLTGGDPRGTNMSSAEIRTFGYALAPRGSVMAMWKYTSSMFSNSSYRSAFGDIATKVSTVTPAPLTRTD